MGVSFVIFWNMFLSKHRFWGKKMESEFVFEGKRTISLLLSKLKAYGTNKSSGLEKNTHKTVDISF